MSWWQITLIILGSIIVGLALGYLINYLIVIITKRVKIRIPLKKRAATERPVTEKSMRNRPASEPQPTVVIPEPPQTRVPNLFTEIENNRRLASQQWTGNLQLFQTQIWDTKRDEAHLLPAELREELAQAYFDMSLANSIVWLATEMGRRSSSLDESYLKLCTSIADRLNRLKSPLEQLGLPQN